MRRQQHDPGGHRVAEATLGGLGVADMLADPAHRPACGLVQVERRVSDHQQVNVAVDAVEAGRAAGPASALTWSLFAACHGHVTLEIAGYTGRLSDTEAAFDALVLHVLSGQ